MYSKGSVNIFKYIILVGVVFFSITILQAESIKLEDKIGPYFASSSVKRFYDAWHKSRKSFENGVAAFLKESYGATGGTMNVYVKREDNPQELCSAFLVNDNIVNVLLMNLFLRELPHVLTPDIAMSLAHNVIRIETKLNKMFLDADYILMRNRSDIQFEVTDPLSTSPFVRQQVQTKGLVTVVAEDCHLIGEAVITLIGVTPHIGESMFRVVQCKFSIEIYRPGFPVPPVIVPYFSRTQSDQLNQLMTQPISSELSAKLQGVVVTLINNTAIFGPDMLQFRLTQKRIFKETQKYMSLMVRELNKASVRENQGVISLDDLSVAFDDGVVRKDDEIDLTSAKVTGVTMNGLDMAYASLRGGPVKMAKVKIIEEIRFYRLQVRGKLHFENTTSKAVYDFAAELIDVPVAIQINIEVGDPKLGVKGKKSIGKVDVQRWRELVFIPGNLKYMKIKMTPGDSFILAYLVQEAPKAIAKHLDAVLPLAIDADADEKKQINQYDDEGGESRRFTTGNEKLNMPLETFTFDS